MTIKYHDSALLTRLTRLTSAELDGMLEDDDGRPLTGFQAVLLINREYARGVRHFKMDDCNHWSDVSGCLGHNQEDIDVQQYGQEKTIDGFTFIPLVEHPGFKMTNKVLRIIYLEQRGTNQKDDARIIEITNQLDREHLNQSYSKWLDIK
jgi:hypothetical protein